MVPSSVTLTPGAFAGDAGATSDDSRRFFVGPNTDRPGSIVASVNDRSPRDSRLASSACAGRASLAALAMIASACLTGFNEDTWQKFFGL